MLWNLSKLLTVSKIIADRREAAKLMERVIVLDPGYVPHHYTAGSRYFNVYYMLHDVSSAKAALSCFEKYLKLSDPKSTPPHMIKAAESHVTGLRHFLKKRA